jgi:hypothetical protein
MVLVLVKTSTSLLMKKKLKKEIITLPIKGGLNQSRRVVENSYDYL